MGFWNHRSNIEYYFRHRYQEFNYTITHCDVEDSIANDDSYFKFNDIKPVLRDLRRMKPKQFCAKEIEILENKPFERILRSLYIRHGMQQSKEKNIHIGRKKGDVESTQKFLNKPKNKTIATELKKGLSIRKTAKNTEASINTVRKVKKLLDESLSPEENNE